MIAVAPISLADLRFGVAIEKRSNNEPGPKRQKDCNCQYHRPSEERCRECRQRRGSKIDLSNAMSGENFVMPRRGTRTIT